MNEKKIAEKAEDYLKAYTNAHGVPGYEGEVAELLRKDLGQWGKETGDKVGSVAFRKGEKGKHILITAHMDEVGFRVQAIDKNGFIKFVPVGGWWGHTLLAQRVLIKGKSGETVVGVIGSKPVHFLPAEERKRVLALSDMYIDIGAASREEAAEMGVSLGDPITPETRFSPMNKKGYYMAKAFDNRVGCAALASLGDALSEGIKGGQLTLAGTVQEEVGTRGAAPLARVLQPDYVIVLESTPADDTVGFPRDESQGKVGEGVQVRLHDPSAIMSPYMAELAVETAQEQGLPHQVAVRTSGGTDAQVFAYANEGIPTVVLGVPSRYIHTHNAVINIADYHTMVRLAGEMAKRLVES